MWTRIELKDRAKSVLRRCYAAALIVALITAIFTGDFSRGGNSDGNSGYVNSYEQIFERSDDGGGSVVETWPLNQFFGRNTLISRLAGMGFGIVLWGIGISLALFSIALGILVGNPIQVGSSRFFMCARQRRTPVGELLYSFRRGEYWNIVLIMLVMRVKIFLWGLLFVIPGIIKSYEYRMIPYILAENPDIAMSEAFALSREMTFGQKMDMFILDLSFFLWRFLSTATLGLAGIFWVNPYMYATNAELYAVLRDQALESGVTNTYVLPGFGEWEER